MPTYDYICKECGYEFERFQQMSEESLVVCPSCEKPTLRRIIGSGAGMIFKGSGFYSTDYKNKGNGSAFSSSTKAKEKKKKTSTGDSASSGTSSTDTKSESSSSSDKK